MAYIASGDGSLYYEVHGKGQPLVLLRGLGRSVVHWLGYERHLAKRARVITIELRGMGLSTARYRWRDDLFANADDVAQVLDHLGLEKAHLMGVSLGGMVSLAFGLKYPERAASLIVMNTSIAGQRTLRLSPRAVAALSHIVRFRDERFHAALVDALVSPSCSETKKKEISEKYAKIAKEQGLGVLTVVKQLAAASRFLVKSRLRKLTLPTLIVYGDSDQFVPNINSKKLAKLLPNGTALEIAGAGHEINLEKADELTAAVGDWLGKNHL